jgi:hypothetical protein
MRPQDFILNFILNRVAPVLFIFVLIMAFMGWFGFFRLKEQRDQLRAEKAVVEQDLRAASAELTIYRASVAGGWPITF